MALNSYEGTGVIFLSVADGSLVRTHKEPNANTKERVTKTGKTVHEERFKDLTGIITGIATKENDYGKQWQITIEDGDEKYVVSMPYSSRYSSAFLKALPNVRKDEPVRFMPWSMTDKQDASKKITGVTMYQDGEKIAPAFTRDNPNGLPEMRKVKVKGVEQWDDTDMMEFLHAKAMAWISDDEPF